MSKKFVVITAVLLLAVALFSGCSVLRDGIPQTGDEPNLQATQNAQIIEAALATATQLAIEAQNQPPTQVAPVQITSTSQPPVMTATSEPVVPTETQVPPTETATLAPPTATATQLPPTATVTPLIPTATRIPPTATPLPCNAAQFIADVSVPDGSTFSPGSTFTKTWRLKNVGTCTWTTAYDLTFYNGDQMNGPSAVDFPGSVAPGQVIDLSVNLTAPTSTGNYKGNWKLRDGSGVLFGVGRDAPFYVDIKVSGSVSTYPYDFAQNYCLAEWTSGAGKLTCPSPDNDSRGFVGRNDNPTLESGYIEDEPALITHPQMITDGVIRGKYPSVRIESGHHFQALIGCANKANSCDVNFQLDYQIGDGAIQTLATWHEVYDEMFRNVDVDLSSLAGKDVRFILTVFANGSSNQDRAMWTAPRIVKK